MVNSKHIEFEKLKRLKIESIGVFGSREEVLDILIGFDAISKPMSDALREDESHYILQPGLHCILPVNLQQPEYEWNGVMYLFYWPLAPCFDMNMMKTVKYMRRVRIASYLELTIALVLGLSRAFWCLGFGVFGFVLLTFRYPIGSEIQYKIVFDDGYG